DFASASASSIARMATSMTLRRVLPGLVLLLSFAGAAMGGLPTVAHEGRDYVELVRAAELLKTRLEATPNGTQARLRPSGHVVGLVAATRTEEIGDGFVEQARLERAGVDAVLRVVFEAVGGDVKVAALADPPRVVLDFLRPGDSMPPLDQRDATAPLRVIVLDAGHGGHDSGAVGPGGLQEKDLVLDVTRRVARL